MSGTILPPVMVSAVVGSAVTVFSMMFVLMNLLVIRIISANKDLRRVNAYRLMIVVGVADAVTSFVNFAAGLSTVTEVSLAHIPYLGATIEAMCTPSYVLFVLITAVLAINRFTLTVSPQFERKLFSSPAIAVWIAVCALITIVFFVGFVSPYAKISYEWRRLAWNYDYKLPYTRPLQTVASAIEVYGCLFASLLYVLTFAGFMKEMQKRSQSSHGFEWKLFIQSFTITAYATINSVLWHYQALLPDTAIWQALPNAIGICNGAVNPLVYFFANVTLRRKLANDLRRWKTSENAAARNSLFRPTSSNGGALTRTFAQKPSRPNALVKDAQAPAAAAAENVTRAR